jgi:hypothetical protein
MILGDRATFCQRDYHKKMIRFSSRAGRMPNPYSPQSNLVFVEQASCLFWKMVQNVSFPHIIAHRGNRSRKVAPCPDSLRALRLPRCARAMVWAIASPSPDPPV